MRQLFVQMLDMRDELTFPNFPKLWQQLVHASISVGEEVLFFKSYFQPDSPSLFLHMHFIS